MRPVVMLALLMIVPAQPLLAHGGRTAADGCHNDRKNGGRHCHGGASVAPRSKPLALRASVGGAFANCSAARAAGAAPVSRGDPGYGAHLDRDGDGIGCE
jgi:hypothetical protein